MISLGSLSGPRQRGWRRSRDGLRRAGGRDFIDAIKKRGTKAGHSFDDPASRREPSRLAWGRYAPGSLWRPIQGYGGYPYHCQVREGHSAAGRARQIVVRPQRITHLSVGANRATEYTS